MTPPDGPDPTREPRHGATAPDAPPDLSDIPETSPGATLGTLQDALERARQRARRGERGTDPGPRVREGEDAVLLRLDGELARRMMASGPDWPERAERALREAFAG